MRILQIGPVPPELGGTTWGGVATHLWNLATELARRNHQVGILADNYRPRNRRTEIDNRGIKIFGSNRLRHEIQTFRLLQPTFWNKARQTKNHFGKFRNWPSIVRNVLTYQRIIGTFQPDVIHAHHLEYRFPFAYFSSDGGIPIITTVHSASSFEYVDPCLKRLVQHNLGVAQNLIFVSNFVKEKYRTLWSNDLNKQRTYTILNPVDTSLYYSLPRDDAARALNKQLDPPLILFVGNLIKLKRVCTLIEAAAILRSTGITFQLCIVGDGPQKPELESLIHELSLAQCVSLEGRKEYPDLLYYYNLADVLVLPSSSEGFPIVVLEALACGCPIVGTMESTGETISSESIGYQCDATLSSLAQQMGNALGTTWDRNYIAEYADKFSWKHTISSFEAAYNEVKISE